MKTKIFTLTIIALFFLTGKALSQVIEDFENGLPIGTVAGDAANDKNFPGSYLSVANPAKSTVNSSAKCLEIIHKHGYTLWGSGNNFGIDFPMNTLYFIDKTSPLHYFHFKYYTATLGAKVLVELRDGQNVKKAFLAPDVTATSTWVDVSFDINTPDFNLTDLAGVYIVPDYGYQTNNRTTDIIVYVDDLQITNSANLFSAVNSPNAVRFSMYPNPTKDIVNIIGAADSKGSLYNSLGQKVLQINITENNQSVNVANLNKGVYLLEIVAKNGDKSTQKLNIQ